MLHVSTRRCRLFRMARRELHDAGGERDEEASERGDPDDENAGARGRGGCRPAYAEDDNYIEQHQIAETDASLEGWSLIHVGRSIPETRAAVKLNSAEALALESEARDRGAQPSRHCAH